MRTDVKNMTDLMTDLMTVLTVLLKRHGQAGRSETNRKVMKERAIVLERKVMPEREVLTFQIA